jgi:hypothetical protein
MKKLMILFVLILTFFVINNGTVNAQEKRLNSSPKSFRTFFKTFTIAVAKNDKTAVASMTNFPFVYGFDAGDEGKMTKTQFIKRFREIFGKTPKSFFTENNPVFSKNNDGSYIISTEDAAHLSFVKKGNSYKFKSYIVEP